MPLRPYQKADAIKLAKLKCSACLNEQRTGKTPTALGVMHYQNNKRVLIICPGSAAYTWKAQFETWLKRPCIVLDGTSKTRTEKLKNWTDGLVITFDTLKIVDHYDKKDKNLPKKERKVVKRTGELFNILKFQIDAVIVDEFHRAKNPKTLTAKALFKLIEHIPHRIALTGTPAYSKNQDIWTMLHFLYPEQFPTYWKFLDEYFNQTTKWTINGTAREILDMKPEKVVKLQNFLSKIATQRKQRDPEVMAWLPKKPLWQPIYLPATAKQTQHLDNLINYFETEDIICKQPIDRLIRYRQICQDPRLLNLKGKGIKSEFLQQYYKDYPEKPTLLFSNFTQYLKLLAEECPLPHAIITGETPLAERRQIELDFQAGKYTVLFLNIKACKENLTLDRAELTRFLDIYPPIGDIMQAVERMTATQESRKGIPKEVDVLLLDKTFETEIFEKVLSNKTTTEILNSFTQYI